jgi:hypothetical protein
VPECWKDDRGEPFNSGIDLYLFATTHGYDDSGTDKNKGGNTGSVQLAEHAFFRREAEQAYRNEQYRPGKGAARNNREQDRQCPAEHKQQGDEFGEPASGRGDRIDAADRPGRPCSNSD